MMRARQCVRDASTMMTSEISITPSRISTTSIRCRRNCPSSSNYSSPRHPKSIALPFRRPSSRRWLRICSKPGSDIRHNSVNRLAHRFLSAARRGTEYLHQRSLVLYVVDISASLKPDRGRAPYASRRCLLDASVLRDRGDHLRSRFVYAGHSALAGYRQVGVSRRCRADLLQRFVPCSAI